MHAHDRRIPKLLLTPLFVISKPSSRLGQTLRRRPKIRENAETINYPEKMRKGHNRLLKPRNPFNIPYENALVSARSLVHNDSFSGELQSKLVEKYSTECQTIKMETPSDSFTAQPRDLTERPDSPREITLRRMSALLNNLTPRCEKTPVVIIRGLVHKFPGAVLPLRPTLGLHTQNSTPKKASRTPVLPFYARRYFAAVRQARKIPVTQIRLPPCPKRFIGLLDVEKRRIENPINKGQVNLFTDRTTLH